MERKDFLDAIRYLEGQVEAQAAQIVNLEEQVELQGSDAFEMAGATMDARREDVELIAAYKEQNTKLITFVEKVGDSKSKFGKEARRILGF